VQNSLSIEGNKTEQ